MSRCHNCEGAGVEEPDDMPCLHCDGTGRIEDVEDDDFPLGEAYCDPDEPCDCCQ